MKRREFVLTGVTATATLACTPSPMPASVPAAATTVHVGTAPLFGVIFDQRFAAAVDFGTVAAWRGHKVFGYDGDLTPVWVNQIEPHWSRRAGVLAGISTAPALFCLEQLAAQHWLRVVTRTAYRAGPRPTLISWVIA